MDAGPWGKMGAHWRLDQVAGADNGQLRNEALPGPLLGSLPPASLIKSWGRGAPRRRRVHCVQGAGEVSRGDWEGPGNEKMRRRLVYLWGRPRFLVQAGPCRMPGGRAAVGLAYRLVVSSDAATLPGWERKVSRYLEAPWGFLPTFPKAQSRGSRLSSATNSVTLGKSLRLLEP